MDEEANKEEKRFSTPQIAAAYGISRQRVRAIIISGRLSDTKSGRGYSIPMSVIVRFGVERGMDRDELIAKLNKIYDRS